ncbi:MAG: hypothetical protein U0T85_04065 [Cloacibacterium normanense]
MSKLIRIKYYESHEANRDKQILLEKIESFIANEQTIQSDWLSQAIEVYNFRFSKKM